MSAHLDRIAKLLNQAENAGTEAESDTFMQKAQQLATVHSIDLARARHATRAKERTTPVQRDISIGQRGQRGLRTHVDLFLGVADANDVRCTIAHDNTCVYAFGFAEDIDVAEALFASLLTQMVTASEAFRRSDEWRNDIVYVPGRWKGREWIPGDWKLQTWLTARLNFQMAYAARIGDRLDAVKAAEEQRQIDVETPDRAGTALVLASKRQSVDDFFAPERERARGKYRGGTTGAMSHSGWGAGERAADRARLGGATAIDAARTAINA